MTPFDLLSDDVLLDHLSPFLDVKSTARFAQTCRRIEGIFKPSLEKWAAANLLQHSVRGEQDEAKKILKSMPHLLFQKGSVTDYSGRRFKNISPLQYAAWAYDTHLLKMIVNFVTLNQTLRALHQLKELESIGTEHGSHYDFSPLITALKTYITTYEIRGYERSIDCWCEMVGSAQRMVPVHVA